MIALLCLLCDTSGLSAESYTAREATEQRLRLAGPLAWPALAGALHSSAPETRQRAVRILQPAFALWDDIRAAALLLGPFPPSEATFSADRDMRIAVFRVARRNGVWREYGDDTWTRMVEDWCDRPYFFDHCRYSLTNQRPLTLAWWK